MFSQMMFGNFSAIDTPIPTVFNVQILEEMLSDCKIIRYDLLKHVKIIRVRFQTSSSAV
jgi:hypothetical protein